MKVALDGRELADRGTGWGRYTQSLAVALGRLFPGDTYYLLRNGPVPGRRWGPGNLEVVPSPPLDEATWENSFLPEHLLHLRADVFHHTRGGCHHYVPVPVPYVVTVHDLIPLTVPSLSPPRVVERMRAGLPAYLRSAAAVIAVSRHTRHELYRRLGLDPRWVQVIYAAADPVFRPRPRPGEAVGPILYVGRFERRKNVVALLEAYARLPAALRRRHRLVLGGTTDGIAPVRRWLARRQLQDAVTITGHLDDTRLADLYGRAALFVYPSLHEGFGLPPLEAMQSGVPVVASAAAALPEVLGRAALLVDTSDPAVLAAAIVRVLGDARLRRRLVGRGLRRAAAFSWERAARLTRDLYATAAGRKPLPGGQLL